jgi:uncharacterized FAD-dependent dehydrogenase
MDGGRRTVYNRDMNDRIIITLPVGDLGRLEQAVRAAAPDAAGWRVARRSLDARRRRRLEWVLSIDVRRAGAPDFSPIGQAPAYREPARSGPPVVIVGAGPAGLFAATALTEAGIPVEVIDRGAGFPARHHHVAALRRRGVFDPESNYRFGLGGAGTYSDGKIFTRKRGPAVREVLARLAWLGDNEGYAVDARPHVGTNRLVPLLERLRGGLADAGVVFRFDTRVEGLRLREGRVRGVRTRTGDLDAAAVILAPGNAARDTYLWLDAAGVSMAARGFAVGVRVEHPRALIDGIQHGALAGHPELDAAEYRLAFQSGGRGVYTFCMCPGGHVLPVPAEPGGLAINGMSHAARASAWSNAALVTTVGPADWDGEDVLAGMRFQRRLEAAAAAAGGGGCHAPAEDLPSFLAGAGRPHLPASSYRPGLVPADLGALLPAALGEALREGLRAADRTMRGYTTAEACVIGLETTTASPVQILRGEDLASVSHPGLHPCGEGAGYAGGITSSAADGLATGRAVARALTL